MIRITVNNDPQSKRVFAPKHNLICLRIVERNDRMIRFKPTGSDFLHRIGVALSIAFVAGPLYALGRYGRTRADEFGNEMLVAVIGLEIIGILGGYYILGMLLRWFLIRFSLYLDERGNLLTSTRGWTTQRSTLPLNELDTIQYDIELEKIRSTSVHEIGPRTLARVWIHVLTLVFQPPEAGSERRYLRFLLASQDTPPQPGERLPEMVRTVGNWLSRVTDKPIVRGEPNA
jgi:hypothetical protein